MPAKPESLPHPRIGVVPYGMSSVTLPNKIYPPDQWAELGRRLTATYPAVLHLGAKADGLLMPTRKDQPPPSLKYFEQSQK